MSTHINPWVASKSPEKVEAWVAEHGEAAMAAHATTDPYFALWLAVLNGAVGRRVGLGYRDLEDWMYYDAYEGGMSPVEAAEEMLLDNGYEWPGADS